MHRKCLACVLCRKLHSLETEPETRIHAKVIYWKAILGKARGKREQEGKEAKKVYQAKLFQG